MSKWSRLAVAALFAGLSQAALAYSSFVPLVTGTVTTGGTAVVALNAGGANAGGTLMTTNAAGICVNQNGPAATSTGGSTMCVAANQIFNLIQSGNAVSVNSTGSGVTFAGWGLN